MRNLLEFIWKNQFTLIFLVLEIIGFFLLTSTNNFHQSKLYQASVRLSGAVYNVNQSYEQYLGLQVENEKLRTENARLREELFSRPETFSGLNKSFETIPSKVIMSTYNRGNNFVIIDKGSNHGIASNMGVVSPKGVVGKVIHTSSTYAAILPILHSQSVISVQLKDSKYFGLCKWNQFDATVAQLLNIPNHVEVQKGDTIITRGGTGIFPQGEVLGFVLTTEKNNSEGFQEIDFQLAADFRNLDAVYVIDNKHKPSLDTLLNSIEGWEEK